MSLISKPGGLCTKGLHPGAIAHSGASGGGELEDTSPASLTFFATFPPFSLDTDEDVACLLSSNCIRHSGLWARGNSAELGFHPV